MNPTVSVREVALALGVSESTIYERVRTGEIPNVALGRRVQIPSVWLRQHMRAAGVPQPARIELVASGTFT